MPTGRRRSIRIRIPFVVRSEARPSAAQPPRGGRHALPAPDLHRRSRPSRRRTTSAAAMARGVRRLHRRRSRSAACSRPARRSSRRPTATTVRVRDGQTVTTDGPFAETKEALGGFYLSRRATSTRRSRWPPKIPAREARLDRGPPDLGAAGRVRDGRGGGQPRRLSRRRALRRLISHRALDAILRRPSRRRRPPVPRGAGPGRRHPDPRPRRLRPRRGGRPGRVHHRARDVARARCPGQPGRLDHDDRSEPGDRSAPPAEAFSPRRRSSSGAQVAIEEELAAIDPDAALDGATAMSPIVDDRLRLIFTCCHPALPMDGRVALTLRTLGGLSTPEIARAFLVPGGDARPAARPGQEEDPRRGDPVSRPGRRRAARSARRRAAGPLPGLQRGLPRHRRRSPHPPRAVRGGDPPDAASSSCADAGRAGGPRPPRADAVPRRPARDADGPGRRARPPRRPGPLAAGIGARIDEGRATLDRAMRMRRVGPVPAPGGDRGAPRRGAVDRGDRLAADRRRCTGSSAGWRRRRSSS